MPEKAVFLFFCCALALMMAGRSFAAERVISGEEGGGVFGEGVGRAREKRSDDFPASEVALGKLAQQVTRQESQITALQNQQTQLQAALEAARTEVGFYAYHGSSRFTVPSGGTLILDRVYTNTGNGFDTHSGTFTAPLSGVYAFFLTVRSYTDDTVSVYITLNGSARTLAYVTHRDATGSASVFLHANKGERVWLKSASSGNHDIYGSIYTHFSGFLVQADPYSSSPVAN